MPERKPIVIVSSWPPRECGIATFAEEATEFIHKRAPDRPIRIISHTDGRGANVFPIIDPDRPDWHRTVSRKIHELDPYAVHLQHEYSLYEHVDENGNGDRNARVLELLQSISDFPTVVEPHTVHGRMKDHEEAFIRRLAELCNVLIFKCHYQKWRLDWTFRTKNWDRPRNIMVIPHGARPDRRYPIHEVPALKEELGLEALKDKRVVGLVGWIQSNKRWDIFTSMWTDLRREILERTGEEWVLLGAGDMRDWRHREDYEKYVTGVKLLQEKGLAHFYEFTPRGEIYYKVMSICDFIVLPSIDETQSGTLARVIALNKPYVTTAPLEGLTAQTLESGGGLLFTNKAMLREKAMRLATDENLRWELGFRLYRYLMNEVSWEVIAGQYFQAYELANAEAHDGRTVEIPPEF